MKNFSKDRFASPVASSHGQQHQLFGAGKPNSEAQARSAAISKTYNDEVKRVKTVRYNQAMEVLTSEQREQYWEVIGPSK